jgi:hypothetical protein
VDRDPEERREETPRQREEREAASEGRKGDRRRRRDQKGPRERPLGGAEPSEREEVWADSTGGETLREGEKVREEPHRRLVRPWWRRMFGG